MRCLTLAGNLRNQGAEVVFFCREFPGNMISFVEDKGYRVCRLPWEKDLEKDGEAQDLPAHADWLGTDWEEDAAQTVDLLKAEAGVVEWMIVDHYALDYRWESQVKALEQKIMVIDDLADRRHECDLLLDQNYHANYEKRYDGLISDESRKLLGPKYALLRPEFVELRKTSRERDGSIRSLLIFFGGSDPGNETAKTLLALQSLGESDIAVGVVVGSMNPHKQEIRTLCSNLPKCTYHDQIDNMAELMNSADLMIGAGGSTTWERCCIGLPAIVAGIAENQHEIAEDLAGAGVIYYLGRSFTTTIASYHHAILALAQSPWIARMFSRKGSELVDGRGCDRVLSALLPPQIELRHALAEDSGNIFKWRNAPETRQYFFDPEPIAWADHKDWLASKLADPNCVLLIGIEKKSKEPVGVLRYDLCKDVAVVSVYLVPRQQGSGFGSSLLSEGTRWIIKKLPQIVRIEAEILSKNSASEKAFRSANYRLSHSTYFLDIPS